MENNIFEGAKFGDRFLTRDGSISLFIRKCHLSNPDLETDYYRFYILNDDETLEYNVFDGGYCIGNDNESPLDIISHYQESINEEELDDYITRHYIELINTLPIPYDDCIKECIECFKIGYRKAMEE